jgi:hypothetical protein
MLCGLVTIVAGIWFFYFRSETPDTFMASLSTAAGMIVNVISGIFLYLHNRTQRRALFYYGGLLRLQQIGLTIRLSETHEDDKERASSRNRIIEELLSVVRATSEIDAKTMTKEK